MRLEGAWMWESPDLQRCTALATAQLLNTACKPWVATVAGSSGRPGGRELSAFPEQAMDHLESFIAECDRRTELAKKRLAETQEEISAEVSAKVRLHALCELTRPQGGPGCGMAMFLGYRSKSWLLTLGKGLLFGSG